MIWTPISDLDRRTNTTFTITKRCSWQSIGCLVYCRALHNTGYNLTSLPLCISLTPYKISECCVFFNQCLYRGNRVSKQSSYDLNAFGSSNFPPLVHGQFLTLHLPCGIITLWTCAVGIDIVVDWNNVIRQTSLRRFRAHKGMIDHERVCGDKSSLWCHYRHELACWYVSQKQ